jgi:hypothetical protein
VWAWTFIFLFMFKQVPFFSVCELHPVLHRRRSGASRAYSSHIAVCTLTGQVVSIAACKGASRAILRTAATALFGMGRL